MSQYGRPEYSAVRCLLFGANLTDVGILSYVCLLFPDGKNILAFRACTAVDGRHCAFVVRRGRLCFASGVLSGS